MLLSAGGGHAEESAEDVFAPFRSDVDAAVDRGLRFLASQQKRDGSFHGRYGETAGLASLVGMAFLAKGSIPGERPHGAVLDRCIDRVLSLSLSADHVLYCMDNETSGSSEWSRYWCEYVKSKARERGRA